MGIKTPTPTPHLQSKSTPTKQIQQNQTPNKQTNNTHNNKINKNQQLLTCFLMKTFPRYINNAYCMGVSIIYLLNSKNHVMMMLVTLMMIKLVMIMTMNC